jgi:hypothetical protein
MWQGFAEKARRKGRYEALGKDVDLERWLTLSTSEQLQLEVDLFAVKDQEDDRCFYVIVCKRLGKDPR